jgi:hypothetical protein
MKLFYGVRIDSALSLGQCILIAFAMGSVVPVVCAQAVPDDTQAASSLEQAATYPVQSQIAETPNLNSLNENADTITYSDNALTSGPLFLSIDGSGTFTSNLEESFDNQPTISGGYFNVGIPVGVRFWTPVTNFTAFFRDDTSFYPGHTGLNHSSEIYSQQLTHQFSDTTSASWSLAGGHVVSVGHYLSPVIAVGTTGVVAPQGSSGLEFLTDAATTFSLAHQTSARNSWTASATGGWFDAPVYGATPGSTFTSEREFTGGGDVQWQHALNSREIAGVEFTNVYINGIAPSGMSNFASAKLTFGQTLTPHSAITVGVGPLDSYFALTGTPDQNNVSYTANAGIEYRRTFGHITAGYTRLYALGYLAPTDVANELYFTFDRQLAAKIFLTADAQYLRSSVTQKPGTAYSTFGYTTRLEMYLTHNLAYHVEGSSFIQQTGPETAGYSDNNVSTGITFYFRSPFSRAGVE